MPLDGQEKANEKALSKGGKVRLLSLGDLDRRTRAAGYAEDTRNAIVADLGGDDALSTLERIQAENLAVTSAVLRDMQLRWLKGEPIDPSALATIENTFNRMAAALGTKRRAKEVMTIHEHLEPERRGT